MENRKIADYYDNILQEQLKSGINERIYHLYKKLLHLGVKPNSNILELGSGIGTLTFLLSKYIRKGNIEAVDLSPKSVEFAKQKIKHSHVSFAAADIVNYQPDMQRIDFVTLFDVIEHIPLDRHNDLFKNISSLSHEQTKVLINIPNPAYLEYEIKNNPDSLQIIDQPVSLNFIIKNLEENGLTLIFFETYSIWVENDYQLFVIEKKKEFSEIKLSSNRTFFQKLFKKLERILVKIRHAYT